MEADAWATEWSGFGVYLGMTIWAFEGINTAIFVYQAMELNTPVTASTDGVKSFLKISMTT